MSHPNPQHDRSNEYPEDKVTHYPRVKHNALKKKAMVGSKEEAHLTIVKSVGKHANQMHDKKKCPVCSTH